jgi:hypothetical protein
MNLTINSFSENIIILKRIKKHFPGKFGLSKLIQMYPITRKGNLLFHSVEKPAFKIFNVGFFLSPQKLLSIKI